jgi:tRNA dimethylallyltransferase
MEPKLWRNAAVTANVPSNNPNNNLPVLIAGPTGVGKTEFAVALAERVGGEIVCADALQIYGGFRLLTARPDEAAMRSIPHHLFGFLALAERWDVARHVELSHQICREIVARGRRPILVGGTGLYFQAFLFGLDHVPPADPTLRIQLEKLTLTELQAELNRLDPKALDSIDAANPRRVQRALEIVSLSGRPLAEFRAAWQIPARPAHGFLLSRPRPELLVRQHRNIEHMLAHGALHEVAAASQGEVSPTAAQAIGYRELLEVVRGNLPLSAAREKIVIATRQYAKRQTTWFRHRPQFQEIPLAGVEIGPSLDQVISLAQVSGKVLRFRRSQQ